MSNESDFWTRTRREMAAENDLSVFKTWNTVRSIPIYKDDEFPMTYPVEVEYMLRRRPREEIERWKAILNEPFLGHTPASYKRAQLRFLDGTEATSWTTKSAHHILTFEGMSGRSIKDYDRIVEFGAGIGETARLILDLGFTGQYYILDLPEIGRISSYYLGGRAKYCKDKNEISREGRTLFIATWSLSEVPESYKDEIAEYFRGSDFLIIFQGDIFGYDNYSYFTKRFPEKSGAEIALRPIPWHKGAGGNHYVYATAKGERGTGAAERHPGYALPPLSKHRLRVARHYFLSHAPRAAWRRARKLLPLSA